jgi:anaerobic selenocysteine-containing dehydrogenase
VRVSAVPDGWNRGEERWLASSCGQCPAACGIRVRVREGRALKIEGDPRHPVSQGGLGPKGQSGLQALYHPDRIRGPLRREGARGEGRWKPISWDDALAEIGERLRALRGNGEAHGLVVVDGEQRGILRDLWARFLRAYGSPNHVVQPHPSDGGKRLAMTYMCGSDEVPAFAWGATRYVFGFGSGLFESTCQTIHLMRTSGDKRRGLFGPRVKFVQASSRFSVTAAKADEWLPIAPGSHGALALGLAHVLVRDSLYDEDLVRDRTFGFEGWTDAEGRVQRGFRELLLEDYAPQKVAEITGVAPQTIERLALELSANTPATALGDGMASATTNGLGTAMAIHALNALLGNLERPGGALTQRPVPLAPWADFAPDEKAVGGGAKPRVDGARSASRPLAESCPEDLPAAILAARPYPVGALVFSRSNPILSSQNARLWQEALARVPLVVSCASLSDETTLWADFVLPEPSYLERWEVVEPAPSEGYALLVLRRPVVEPLHDTLHAGDAVLRLARAVGEPVSAALPWGDFRAATLERLAGDAAATGSTRRGATEILEPLERDGWWRNSDEPLERNIEPFATPSGRFEFFSQTIAARLSEHFPDEIQREAALVSRGVASRGDAVCLPHWEPPALAGDPARYTHVLVPHRGIEHLAGGSRHIPLLRELPTSGRDSWKERVELHPAHARELGVGDGDAVQVESPSGRARLCVRLSPGIRPGTVGLALGGGPWPPEPEHEGAADLLAPAADPLAGIAATLGTRVLVCKVKAVV